MLKTKTKSSKQISKKKTKEKYSRELIEQIYKMTYAMLKLKYINTELKNSEIEGKAIVRVVKLLVSNDLQREVETKSKIDFEFYLYKEISNKLNIEVTK